MSTTVDIPEDVLERAMRAAGTSSPKEAVVKALEEFSQRHSQRDLIKHLGTFDKFLTPQELDDTREQD